MKKLLIATTNPGKLAEIKYFLKDLPLRLLSLVDIGIKEKPEENHATFKKNAIHKAKFYCQKSGLPTIADDGGLEIDYLQKEPGVKSRRWINGKDEASDEELIAYALKKLKGVPKGKRGAQLRAVMALALPNGKVSTASAKVRGVISQQPYHTTTPGYPYRSLLYLSKIGKFYHSSEMTEKEIEKYNHRGKALANLTKMLYKYVIC